MIALCISRDARLWEGHLSRALAPGLDELNGSPSSFPPKLGKNSLPGWDLIAPEITGGMAADKVLSGIKKKAVVQIFVDRHKLNESVVTDPWLEFKTNHRNWRH